MFVTDIKTFLLLSKNAHLDLYTAVFVRHSYRKHCKYKHFNSAENLIDIIYEYHYCRASMALACQMKAHAFCVVFNEHHSNPMQTIQTLANDCDPGQRLSILETHCQELRKLFKDLIKPSDGSLKGKLKDVALDITKDFPPVQGVVMSEGCKVAHLVSEGNNLQSVPRGSYVYSTISIPVKVRFRMLSVRYSYVFRTLPLICVTCFRLLLSIGK